MGLIVTDSDEISRLIIRSAMRIHSEIGPGLFESVYDRLLGDDIVRTGLDVERQKNVPISVRDRRFKKAFRPDLVVAGCVVVEVKSEAAFSPVDAKQLLTYLRLLNCRVGLLLNFGTPSLGIKRILNGY